MATPPPDGRGRRVTADLATSLEPGETVVFWTRGRSLAATAIPYVLFIVCLVVVPPLILLDAMAVMPDRIDWRVIRISALVDVGIIAVAVAALLMARQRQAVNPDDFMITSRRVLFADNYWVDSIELEKIDRVGWATRDGVRFPIIIGDGQTIWLSHLRERDAAVKAIADATGTPSPPLLGPLAVIDSTFVGMAAVMTVIVVAFKVVIALLGPAEFATLIRSSHGSVMYYAAAPVAVGMVLGLGRLIGDIVLATILRPFMTPERLQTALCAGRPDQKPLRMALRWAGLLYGRPLPYLAT